MIFVTIIINFDFFNTLEQFCYFLKQVSKEIKFYQKTVFSTFIYNINIITAFHCFYLVFRFNF